MEGRGSRQGAGSSLKNNSEIEVEMMVRRIVLRLKEIFATTQTDGVSKTKNENRKGDCTCFH
jgi:hypothetical protein